MLNKFLMEDHVRSALIEDIGYGDITTENLADENDKLKGFLNTREDGVLCGVEVFKTVYKMLSCDIKIDFHFKDGDIIKKGDCLADLKGPAKELLMGERLSLNYIQRMSGIATETKKYQDAIFPYHAKIVDTRKTTPNFRMFEKYAVKTGGGALHRFNLADCAMIKDNHIRLAGSVKEAVKCKADIIMLDNMSVSDMKQAVELINNAAIVEASGNVKLSTVNEIASTGVDIISSSAIVAKAPALDIALDM